MTSLADLAVQTGVTERGGVAIAVAADAGGVLDAVTAAALLGSGVRQIDVSGHVTLSPGRPAQTLAFVRFLREASAAGAGVTWAGIVDPAMDAGLLHHLPPPRVADGQAGTGPVADAAARAWRRAHATGLFHYRVGPGCVQVFDSRGTVTGRGRQVTLRSAPELQAFEDFLVPRVVPAAGDRRLAAYPALRRARLLLELGGRAVLLPHRLLCRPVPWNVF